MAALPPGDADLDFCYVTTTGRVSGRPHRIEIWFAAAGSRSTLYLLSGGGAASDWVANLRAQPQVTVEVGAVTYTAEAREPHGDVASEARALVFAKYQPRYAGDLTSWRDSALPIALDLL